MNFPEARIYLEKALVFGIRPGLGRMTRLTDMLGHPEAQLRCIHIAGTNGKGSASSYCASILAAAGLRVGLFTSPYLERLTERIRVIDGRAGLEELLHNEAAGEISEDDFAAAMTQVAASVSLMTGKGQEQPTEFELLTAIGFLHFKASRCEVVVLETGLGGRLDSTNVIAEPLACLITALGYDHTDRLGESLAEIAREKAGIIKAGRPVYLYDPCSLNLPAAETAAALQVIQQQCSELGAPLQVVLPNELSTSAYDWDGQTFTDLTRSLILRTSLLGLFQPMNAALALRACKDLGLCDDAAVADGIRLARWPARMEILRRHPPVILDGCHNPQGCQALAAALGRLLPEKPVVFLAGIFRDKDYRSMLQAMLDHPGYCPAALVLASPDSPRALPADELARVARQLAGQLPKPTDCGYNILDAIHIAETPAAGAHLALRLAGSQGMALCAFGSLHFAGSVRGILGTQEGQFWTGLS
jgi:dihydrofolate synthase / folylpolyglutamate synthase